MTEAQAREAISEAVIAAWAAVGGGAQLALDNEALPNADTFGQLTIKHSVADQITMGNAPARKFERKGTFYVKVWLPSDGGGGPASTLLDGLRGYLESASFVSAAGDPVTTLGSATREAGVDGRWFMSALTVPFYYFQTR